MEDDRAYTHLSSYNKNVLKRILTRALNKNQILILSEIDGTSSSVSSFLRRIAYSKKVPLSTLKLNLKTLKELNLVYLDSRSSSVELTQPGKLLLDIILGDVYE